MEKAGILGQKCFLQFVYATTTSDVLNPLASYVSTTVAVFHIVIIELHPVAKSLQFVCFYSDFVSYQGFVLTEIGCTQFSHFIKELPSLLYFPTHCNHMLKKSIKQINQFYSPTVKRKRI